MTAPGGTAAVGVAGDGGVWGEVAAAEGTWLGGCGGEEPPNVFCKGASLKPAWIMASAAWVKFSPIKSGMTLAFSAGGAGYAVRMLTRGPWTSVARPVGVWAMTVFSGA